MKRIGVYAFHHPRGMVPEYVIHKLDRIRGHVDGLIVVCNGELASRGRESLGRVADDVRVRDDHGFAPWAHRHGLIDVVGWGRLAAFDEVLLFTSGVYGPIFPLAELFRSMEERDVDFWGVTAFNGPAVDAMSGNQTIPFHVHTTFLGIRQRLFSATDFQAYWEALPAFATPRDAIHEHEQRFTPHFLELGYRVGVYAEEGMPAVPNPPREIPDVLLAKRCPFLSRQLFFEDAENVHGHNVEIRRALEVIEHSSDYPTRLIWQDILPLAVPRNLYTSTSLLDVLSTDGTPPVPTQPPRIAVLAHVFYPDMLDEMAARWSHIPLEHDLHVTTPTPEDRGLLEDRLAAIVHPLRRRTEVRVVPNRGRDVSAWLIGQRDVIVDGGYDLICRLHSKRSPQNSFGLTRHFKETLFDNLLASTAHVTRVLQLFANEPCLGIVMPPAVHMGCDTLGHGWHANRPEAESLARALNIGVPFDEFTPLATYGSMFWARPEALRLLAEHSFSWDDFPDEAGYRDGDLSHVIERLVVYAAHETGYYSKCVLTPEHAARNYVALEFRLQRECGRTIQRELAEQRCEFPRLQLLRYFDRRLPAGSMSRRVATTLYHAARRLVSRARPRNGP